MCAVSQRDIDKWSRVCVYQLLAKNLSSFLTYIDTSIVSTVRKHLDDFYQYISDAIRIKIKQVIRKHFIRQTSIL
jgi:hypothetical protein